jgi:hypothetical protein
MREILFKARRLDHGDWISGSLICFAGGGRAILPSDSKTFFSKSKGFICCDTCHDVDPSTVCQYTNINTKEEVGIAFESHKIFTGDRLGEWGEDEDGNECVCILGIVTYWESEGRYVLADEHGLCNDWTLEDKTQPENWPQLIHCGNIHDGADGGTE